MSLAERVRGMVSRCVVNLVSDAFKLQALQVTMMADQTADDVEHYQHYGFTSVPLPGAEGVALAVGGSTGHTLVINVDDRRYRLRGLPGGEVALYDDQGQKVHLTRGGIVIDGAGKPVSITNTPSVTMTTPQVTCTGHLTVGGNLAVVGNTSMAGNLGVAGPSFTHQGGNIGNGHTHGGVQDGPDRSGLPG